MRVLYLTLLSSLSLWAVTYRCPTGQTLEVRFIDQKAVVRVVGMPEITLPQAMSGSGARYSDGYTTFWEKGGVALLEAGSVKVQDCKAVPAALSGKFTLMELDGQPVKLARPAFMEFAEGGRVSGSLGCNRFSGSYQGTLPAIKFGPMMSTKMACMGEGDRVERGFSQALNTAAKVELFEGKLRLMDAAGKTRAVLRQE